METKLIFGCGYLGMRVASRWLALGHRVSAVTRSTERGQQLRGKGIEPIIADVTNPQTLGDLPPAETVLFAVGFDRSAGHAIDDVYVGGLANVLDAISLPTRFIYISSTGVYGQTDGSWVDENSVCNPARAGGKACLAAEKLLRSKMEKGKYAILRCAGLYGPGRIPRLENVRAQRDIPARDDTYLNLIHIEDAADVVISADRVDQPAELLTVSDGQPVLRREFYAELARLLDAPPPRFTTGEGDTPSRRTSSENKRVDNQRMRQLLGAELRFLDYRSGLAATVQQADQGN